MPSELPPPPLRAFQVPRPPCAARSFASTCMRGGRRALWDYWRVLVVMRSGAPRLLGSSSRGGLDLHLATGVLGERDLRIDREGARRQVRAGRAGRPEGIRPRCSCRLPQLLQSRALAPGSSTGSSCRPARVRGRSAAGRAARRVRDRLQVARFATRGWSRCRSRAATRAIARVAMRHETFIAQQLDHRVEATRHASDFLSTHVEDARRALEGGDQLNLCRGERHPVRRQDRSTSARRAQSLVGQQLVTLSEASSRPGRSGSPSRACSPRRGGRTRDSLPRPAEPAHHPPQAGGTALEGKYRELSQTSSRSIRACSASARTSPRSAGSSGGGAAGWWRRSAATTAARCRTRRAAQAHGRAQGGQRRWMPRWPLQPAASRGDPNRQLYATLSTRLKETRISGTLLASNISVVDAAEAR